MERLLPHILPQRDLPSFDDDTLYSRLVATDKIHEPPFAPDVDAKTLTAGPVGGICELADDGAGHCMEERVMDKVFPPADSSEVRWKVQPRDVPLPTSHDASGPSRTLRVTAPTGPTASPDPDRNRAADAEHLTKVFECANGRWPLLVAHLPVTRAYGCDYLSFDTEEKHDAFITIPDQIDLVSRFIETKSGRVKFTDHE